LVSVLQIGKLIVSLLQITKLIGSLAVDKQTCLIFCLQIINLTDFSSSSFADFSSSSFANSQPAG
jgi:hypothetical protein